MYQKTGKGREADKVSHRDKIGCVCGGDDLCGCNSRIGYKAKLLQIKNGRGNAALNFFVYCAYFVEKYYCIFISFVLYFRCWFQSGNGGKLQ